MEIKDNILQGDNIKFIKSPNTAGVFKPGAMDTVIIHFTAGSTAESAIRTLCDDKVAAKKRTSAHIVIGQQGEITQLVPFNTVAWHAGDSQYQGRSGFNQYSIGIEIDNPGELTKSGDKYISWFNKVYPESEVVYLTHRNQSTPKYWHTFTEKQIEAVFAICAALDLTYPIKYILGHEEISPLRKTDPGPAFPLEKLRDRILNSRQDDGVEENVMTLGKVKTDLLNIRLNPDKTAEMIAKPLKKGQNVTILEEKNGWLKVTTEITGWVAKDFVES